MRPLKHHEKKLLKKVDFLQWKREHNIREAKVLARFLIADREDYSKYGTILLRWPVVQF
jgi:U3 small nucleolar ribonucleoprotein protein IMP3